MSAYQETCEKKNYQKNKNIIKKTKLKIIEKSLIMNLKDIRKWIIRWMKLVQMLEHLRHILYIIHEILLPKLLILLILANFHTSNPIYCKFLL